MLRLFLLSIIAFMLCACSYLHPYRPTIQQGNIIQADQVAQLKVGMDRSDVTALMGGSPVLNNLFNDNELDYVYTSKPNNGPLVYKRVVITFQNDKVTNIEQYPVPNH